MRPSRPDPGFSSALRRATVAGVALAAFVTTSAALAGFTSTGSVGATYVTKRIFPGVRSAWAWDIRDASGGGAETNSSDTLSFADGTAATTKSWSSTFASTRFDDFDFSAGLPAGVSVTSATFNFTFAATRNADTVCFYLDVRRASTNALLGTHGSSGSPSSCVAGKTLTAATVRPASCAPHGSRTSPDSGCRGRGLRANRRARDGDARLRPLRCRWYRAFASQRHATRCDSLAGRRHDRPKWKQLGL